VGTICAIHQPNFFPWLGYFDKIRRADMFVFLDEVDYPRSGSKGMGSWTNRVKIDIHGAPTWIGCPVERLASGSVIRDARIATSELWQQKLLRTLQINYRRAPGFDRAYALIEPLLKNPELRLVDYNTTAIRTIAAELGMECKFLFQSQIGTREHSTALLIEVLRAVGADAYLCGGGASGYQDDTLFERSGVRVIYQDYASPAYGTPEKFIPGLSVIDYLMKVEDWGDFPGSQ